MTDSSQMKRIVCVTGHGGSGKTEFAINYAIKMKREGQKVALCDLDITNPYFRSRQQQKILENMGIRVFSNTFNYDISEDLPAVSPQIRVPLDNKEYLGIYDVGGDDIGARILNQYKAELEKEKAHIFLVVNAYRPETWDMDGVLRHIQNIEEETGLKINGLVNNSHLLENTSPENLFKGHILCKQVEAQLGIPLFYDMVTEEIYEEVINHPGNNSMNLSLFAVKLFSRPSWLGTFFEGNSF